MQNIDVTAALERVVSARHRLEQHRDHLDVALGYRRALTPFRSYEIEDAVQLVASTVIDEIPKCRPGHRRRTRVPLSAFTTQVTGALTSPPVANQDADVAIVEGRVVRTSI